MVRTCRQPICLLYFFFYHDSLILILKDKTSNILDKLDLKYINSFSLVFIVREFTFDCLKWDYLVKQIP